MLLVKEQYGDIQKYSLMKSKLLYHIAQCVIHLFLVETPQLVITDYLKAW